MAKSFEIKGDLANALRTLETSDGRTPAELRRAIALVHGARNFSPTDLANRFAGSDRIALNPETGRLTIIEKTQAVVSESWVAIAGLAAARTRQSPIVFNKALQDWTVRTKRTEYSQNRTAKLMRDLPNAGQRADFMAEQPAIRQAQLADVEHAKHRDAFDSFLHANETLQVVNVQRRFAHESQPPFRDDFATDERDRAFEVYGTEDGALVRRTQLLGSFARELTLRSEERRARLTASQSILLTKQTVFAVDPEWREVLFEPSDLGTGEYTPLGGEVATELEGLIETRDETIVPLASSLYATQDWRIIATQPF